MHGCPFGRVEFVRCHGVSSVVEGVEAEAREMEMEVLRRCVGEVGVI